MRRSTRLGIHASASLFFGLAATVITSLLFSLFSAAYGQSEWKNVVTRGDRFAWAVSDVAVGKTVLNWGPLSERQEQTFKSTGKFELRDLVAGEHHPQTWSSYWNDAAFAAADAGTNVYTRERMDIAVGWPLRAFSCSWTADRSTSPPTPIVGGGRALPPMMADQGRGYLVSEVRALPFRPIWSGLIVNTLVFGTAAFGVLSLISWRQSRRERASLNNVISRQWSNVWTLSRWRIAACMLLGLLTCAATCILLPLVVRQRSVSPWSTTRPYTSETRTIFWRQRTTRPEDQQMSAINSETAAAFDAALAADEFTFDPARRKTGPRDGIDSGPPNSFRSERTGWPMSCMWGAHWRAGAAAPIRDEVGIVTVPRHDDLRRIINRGLVYFPIRPLVLGWVVNTGFYAAIWFVLLAGVRRIRERRRLQAGKCPRCSYDLRNTPVDAPCPECGVV